MEDTLLFGHHATTKITIFQRYYYQTNYEGAPLPYLNGTVREKYGIVWYFMRDRILYDTVRYRTVLDNTEQYRTVPVQYHEGGQAQDTPDICRGGLWLVRGFRKIFSRVPNNLSGANFQNFIKRLQ